MDSLLTDALGSPVLARLAISTALAEDTLQFVTGDSFGGGGDVVDATFRAAVEILPEEFEVEAEGDGLGLDPDLFLAVIQGRTGGGGL